MINTVRAAAFAVAAFCATLVSVDGTPLWAEQGQAQGPSAYFLDHAAAAGGGDLADLGLNTEVAPAAGGNATPLAAAHASAPVVVAPPPPPLTRLVADEARFDTDGREQDCLANAVYFEARGESLEGQLAVAEVVLNRARSGRYPRTICAVVTQPAQFSFVRRGIIPAADRACEAWRRAVAIARIAQAGETRLLPQNVLWYHANYVSPGWGRRLERSARIGLHIFYS